MKTLNDFTKEEIREFLMTQDDPTDLDVFTKYVQRFYSIDNEDVLYPISNDKEIEKFCKQYVNRCENLGIEFCGDTIDREAIRIMIGK